MIPKPISFFAASLFALVLAGCSNPADNVPEASVENAKAVDSDAESAPAAIGKVYSFTSASKIGFIGSKVTGSHDGGFEKFAGQLTLADGGVEGGQVRVLIDMTSLWSDSERLTRHLKSGDFFDVQAIPTARFDSTSVEKSDSGYTVTGNLNLHGVEKSISFPAQVAVAGDKVTVQSEFSINRFDFNIKFPGKPDDLIRKEVVIKLDLTGEPGSANFEALQAAAAAGLAAAEAGGPGGPPAGPGGRRPGGFSREDVMKRFDTNGDGEIDETERAAMRVQFGGRGGGGRPGGPGRPGAGDRPAGQ